jgi:SRSO17 transposase
MNHATKDSVLPELTADFLRIKGCLIDNVFADLWKKVGMKTMLRRCGFEKRSGASANEVMYCLMLWVWLKVDSMAMFARESVHILCIGGKDVLYEAMKREDWDWRRLHVGIARKAIKSLPVTDKPNAFVLDDTIRTRHGKKMPGISSHFDHTSGRHVMGQQILTLGFSSTQGFVPIDSELFISATKAQALRTPFLDGRSTLAKRYRIAQNQSKPEMAKAMIHRAQRAGIDAAYLLADAWFGTKRMIGIAEDASLIPIVRMKKNKMKYRHQCIEEGKTVYREMDLSALYRCAVRGEWEKVPGQPYQSKSLDVELNLNESSDEKARWIKVRLLFVRGVVEGDKPRPGKHDWATFLTTDLSLSPTRILEIYAMRWAIEVYFKEAKQHLGFLKEQGTHYAGYIASIHLAAIRFCLLSIARIDHCDSSIANLRTQIATNSTHIDFAARVWPLFRALISGALDQLKCLAGDTVANIMDAIESHVQRFFVQALQLDPWALRMESK